MFLFPLVAIAQAPPPEVDQALRARVTEFYQDQVDGNFRKAFDLVAEDTKDFYFSVNKTQYKSFKIDKIEYSDDFTKAAVTLTLERPLRIQSQQFFIPTTNPTSWKIESGKWVWHTDPTQASDTPMGASAANVIKPDPNGNIPLPGKLTPDMIAAAAQRILQQQQSGLSKSEVTLTAGKASSDEVVFHNGAQGSVDVRFEVSPEVAGLHAELDKTSVNGGGDATLKLRYEPGDKPPGSPVTLRLMVAPFGQVFNIVVKFL